MPEIMQWFFLEEYYLLSEIISSAIESSPVLRNSMSRMVSWCGVACVDILLQR
jgi:hypothetical protein